MVTNYDSTTHEGSALSLRDDDNELAIEKARVSALLAIAAAIDLLAAAIEEKD